MTKIKTLIVDDEPLARKGLAVRLEEYSDIEVIKLCSSGADAIEMCQSEKMALRWQERLAKVQKYYLLLYL